MTSRQQRNDVWDSSVAAIDLTLSSPEPDQRPHIPPRQTHPPTHLNREPRPYSYVHSSSVPSRAAGSSRTTGPQKVARALNPEDLRKIINTTDSKAVRKILFDLCQVSPALSGAVARGLAPHSSFARSVIQNRFSSSQYPYTLQSQHIKAEKLSSQTISGGRNTFPTHMGNKLQGYASQAVRPQQPLPPVKREDPSSFDSDDSEIRVPPSVLRRGQRVNMSSTPFRHSSAASSTITPKSQVRPTKSLVVPVESMNTKREPEVKSDIRKCIHCNIIFDDDTLTPCLWHDRGLIKNEDGNLVHICCNRVRGQSAGCHFGTHTDEAEQETGPSDR